MCGLLARFGGVWKTWLKFVRDMMLRTQFGCKNTNKACAGCWFGLTTAGLAWNELVCLNVNGIRIKSLE